MTTPGYVEISHFRAPYKDSYMGGLGEYREMQAAQGYGVYDGVGDDESEGTLLGFWGQNPWGGGGGGHHHRRQQPQPEDDGGTSGFGGFGVVDDPAAGVVVAPPAQAAIVALDPFFTVDGGITFATDATATALDQILQQWAASDQAYPTTGATGDVLLTIYHGSSALPSDAEPAPYVSLLSLLTSLTPPPLQPAVILVDKQLAQPTAGKRTMIVTRNPQSILTYAGSGGSHFVTKDADRGLIAQARALAAPTLPAPGPLAFLGTPFGLALCAAGIFGVLYMGAQK